MQLISVIVPVYNVAPYIERCIKSICNQTYKNLEIILVDDGSTDGSGILCDRLSEKDARIVVVHKANGGLSDARNTGLDIAKGDFVGFVDSDDEIDPEMYDKLYQSLLIEDGDIAACRIQRIESDIRFATRKYNFDLPIHSMKGEDAVKFLMKDELDVSVCSKLFKKELFLSMRFPVGKTNEDFATIYKVLYAATKVVYIEDQLYFYYFRNNSITSSKFNERQFDKFYHAINAVEYFYQENCKELALYAKGYLCYQAFCLLKTVYSKGLHHQYYDQCKQMRIALQKNSFFVVFQKNCVHAEIKQKIAYILMGWIPQVYVKHLERKSA